MLRLGAEEMMIPFDSRAVHLASDKITAELTDAHNMLGAGTLINREAPDAAATGMLAAYAMGRIFGLRAALGHLRAADDEASGRNQRKKEGQKT